MNALRHCLDLLGRTVPDFYTSLSWDNRPSNSKTLLLYIAGGNRYDEPKFKKQNRARDSKFM